MQPESFPIDDSLGRSVQPATAPTSFLRRRTRRSATSPTRPSSGTCRSPFDAARESAVRSVNGTMTSAYWLIGRHIVRVQNSRARSGPTT